MRNVYSVSSVNQYIKSLFMDDRALNNIYVKGEVSNCKYHSSGHIYFTLKDKGGIMACVMFASSRTRGLKFMMQEGMAVIVLGSVSVYERDGRYQLYAREILKEGTGARYEAFEFLKKQLAQEGLFDEAHKKNIPVFPEKVGIVTAATGAAVRDIINVATRRNPYIQLVLYPARVQGEEAERSVSAGIKALDDYGVDVIIAGRGGGSIEDLWAFNEELTARTIYDCRTPVISAVGHETDVTIADFVADLRAPTPSAAAELAVPDIAGVLARLSEDRQRLDRQMKDRIDDLRQVCRQYERMLKHASPDQRLLDKRQQLLDAEERLMRQMQQKLSDEKNRLAFAAQRLHGLSPLTQLARGYAFVTDDKGHGLTCVEQAVKGQEIHIAVSDGDMTAQVTNTIRQERG